MRRRNGRRLDGTSSRVKNRPSRPLCLTPPSLRRLALLWMHGAWTSFGSLELCVSKLNFSSPGLPAPSPLSRVFHLLLSLARSCPLSFQGISSPAALSLLPSFPPFSFLPSLSSPALHLQSRGKLLRSTEVNYKSIVSLFPSLALQPHKGESEQRLPAGRSASCNFIRRASKRARCLHSLLLLLVSSRRPSVAAGRGRSRSSPPS